MQLKREIDKIILQHIILRNIFQTRIKNYFFVCVGDEAIAGPGVWEKMFYVFHLFLPYIIVADHHTHRLCLVRVESFACSRKGLLLLHSRFTPPLNTTALYAGIRCSVLAKLLKHIANITNNIGYQ